MPRPGVRAWTAGEVSTSTAVAALPMRSNLPFLRRFGKPGAFYQLLNDTRTGCFPGRRELLEFLPGRRRKANAAHHPVPFRCNLRSSTLRHAPDYTSLQKILRHSAFLY